MSPAPRGVSEPATRRQPSGRRRATPADNGSGRRAEILAAAAEVFAERGILNATVRDIGERAGILSGSLYHHFTSKEQMVEEILVASGEPMLDRCRAIIETTPDAADALAGCIRTAVDFVAGSPHEAAILRHDGRAIDSIPRLAFIRDRRQATRDLWVELVRRGQRAGAFRPSVDAAFTVTAMWDAILSSARWLPPDGTHSPARVAAQLSELFLGGLRA